MCRGDRGGGGGGGDFSTTGAATVATASLVLPLGTVATVPGLVTTTPLVDVTADKAPPGRGRFSTFRAARSAYDSAAGLVGAVAGADAPAVADGDATTDADSFVGDVSGVDDGVSVPALLGVPVVSLSFFGTREPPLRKMAADAAYAADVRVAAGLTERLDKTNELPLLSLSFAVLLGVCGAATTTRVHQRDMSDACHTHTAIRVT